MATAPNLGTTSTYGVVSGTYTNSNTGTQTVINGDACYTTAPVTPPLSITGTTVTPCAPATGSDQGLATANLNGQTCTFIGAAIALNALIGVSPPGPAPFCPLVTGWTVSTNNDPDAHRITARLYSAIFPIAQAISEAPAGLRAPAFAPRLLCRADILPPKPGSASVLPSLLSVPTRSHRGCQ